MSGDVVQRGLALIVLCLLMTVPGGAARRPQPGGATDPKRLAAVKAGMVVNFLRYTTWPDHAFTDEPGRRAPVVLSIVGEGDIEDALMAAARDQRVDGRAIEIRRLNAPGARPGEPSPPPDEVEAFYRQLRGVHAVYFTAGERARYRDALHALAGADVLTIGDIERFAEGGGMLGLAIRGGRVAFDANEEAIRDTALKVSSHVLKLARIVRPDGGERNR